MVNKSQFNNNTNGQLNNNYNNFPVPNIDSQMMIDKNNINSIEMKNNKVTDQDDIPMSSLFGINQIRR